MTGTPVSERPTDAYSVLRILAPEVAQSRARFERHFVVKVPIQAGPIIRQQPVAYQNLEELKRMLESVSVRRLKSEIRGMPDRLEDVRHCRATPEQARHYHDVATEALKELAGIDPDLSWAQTLDIACVKLLRCRQVLNHPGLLGLSGDSGKYLELDDLLDEVLSNPSAKVVLWSEWNAAVDLLAARYRPLYGAITIDQRTSQADLAKYERSFDTSLERVAICSPAKAGTGIDFLSRARTAVYIEKPYSLVSFKQSIDRIVRRVPDDVMGEPEEVRRLKTIKRSPATVLYMHVPGSVDDLVAHILQIKIDLGDALLMSDRKLIQDGRADLIKMLRERTLLR